MLVDVARRVRHWLLEHQVREVEQYRIVLEVPRHARDQVPELERYMLQDIRPSDAGGIEAVPGTRSRTAFKTCGMTLEFRRQGLGQGKILTSNDFPPIPDRRFDWSATRDGYDAGDPVGHGRSEAEAIGDLIMIEGDLV